jgi:hypothetical protein
MTAMTPPNGSDNGDRAEQCRSRCHGGQLLADDAGAAAADRIGQQEV